jgi:ankyrin repeat protein
MKAAAYVLCVIGLTAVGTAADRVTGSSGATADDILRIIRGNDLKALKDMSRAGVADIRDRLDWTPLHFAALYGSVESVRILLAAGADPNVRNKSDATPLMFAAYSLEKTRLIVEKGGDVNAKTTDGATPLWVATGVHNNEPTIRYLIEKGADPKAVRTDTDYLMRTSGNQDPSTVRLFLERGVDPHRTVSGINALFFSISCNGAAKTRLLLDAGSEVNVANKTAGRVKNGPIESTGVTPLMDAAACGQTESVAALLKAGA